MNNNEESGVAFFPSLAAEKYNRHFTEIARGLRVDGALNPSLAEVDFVFICYTNRCGSNFVAEAMASAGAVNLAQEFLNYDEVLVSASTIPGLDTVQDYISGVVLNDAVGRLFVCKISIEHLTILHRCGVLDDLLPRTKFVFTQRADKLEQAISYAIAHQTQQWSSYNTPAVAEPQFDGSLIHHFMGMIIEQNALFDRFFAENGLKPIVINYEQFTQMPAHLLAFISDAIGRELRYEPQAVNTSIQRSSRNKEWRALYLSLERPTG